MQDTRYSFSLTNNTLTKPGNEITTVTKKLAPKLFENAVSPYICDTAVKVLITKS